MSVQARDGLAAGLLVLALAAAQGACRDASRGTRETEAGAAAAGTPEATKALGSGSGAVEIEAVRLARAAMAAAEIPLYPGSDGLDATEFEANTTPRISVDFFTADPPEKVAAFYDRALKDLAARRTTARELGAVRFEFREPFTGLSVKPWNPRGADKTAMLGHFDRRDSQGVSTSELDRYGRFLAGARTHVVLYLSRPEPGERSS